MPHTRGLNVEKEDSGRKRSWRSLEGVTSGGLRVLFLMVLGVLCGQVRIETVSPGTKQKQSLSNFTHLCSYSQGPVLHLAVWPPVLRSCTNMFPIWSLGERVSQKRSLGMSPLQTQICRSRPCDPSLHRETAENLGRTFWWRATTFPATPSHSGSQ